uniref:Uncharacterized protein n=1 Tax=Eptatretus burgeri TaxID=7764 RepID=A0A8C4WV83_EPTBU
MVDRPLERYKDIAAAAAAAADLHRRLPSDTCWTLLAVGGTDCQFRVNISCGCLQCQRPEELEKEENEMESPFLCLLCPLSILSIQSLGKWGPWGKCSESCGIGIRKREWLCSHGNPVPRTCGAELADKVTPCFLSDCPQVTLHTTTAETNSDDSAPPLTSGLAGGITAFGMVLCSIVIVATLALVLHARLRRPVSMAPVAVAMQEINQSHRHLAPPSFGYALAQEQLRRLRREGRDAGTTTYLVLRHSVGEQAVWALNGLLPIEPIQLEHGLPSAYSTERRATWSGPRHARPSSEVRFQQQGLVYSAEEQSTNSSTPKEYQNMPTPSQLRSVPQTLYL